MKLRKINEHFHYNKDYSDLYILMNKTVEMGSQLGYLQMRLLSDNNFYISKNMMKVELENQKAILEKNIFRWSSGSLLKKISD